MFNPMAYATPKQREELMKMQVLTQRIHYVIHTEDNENRVEVTLRTDDPEAAQLLPQLCEGVVTSVTQMLYQMFAMTGERI
jgi:hypothetical protein